MVLLSGSHSTRASWTTDLSGGLIWDDNVGNAASGPDRESDGAVSILASAARRFDLAAGAAWTLAGNLDGLVFSEFEGLSRVSPGVRVSIRKKCGLGPRAPWLAAATSARFDAFDDSNRQGWFTEAEVRFGKRIGERWAFDAAGGYGSRRADSTVFDSEAFHASAGVEAILGEKGSLRVGYRIRRGDVTSSGTPDPALIGVSEEAVWDPVFGSGIHAYRFDATSHAAEAGFNWALGRDTSLDLRYERIVAVASGGVDYTTNRIGARLLFRL